MPFYQLGKERLHQGNWSESRLVFVQAFKSTEGQEFIVLIFEDGNVGIVRSSSLESLGMVKLQSNSKSIKNLLDVTSYETTIILLTFKDIYLLDLSRLLQWFLSNKGDASKFQVSPLMFPVNRRDEYVKLMSKQIKLIKHNKSFGLKVFGRTNEEFVYYFCELPAQSNLELCLREYYKNRFKNEYKVSLETLSKDIIVYQSYSNKFKPIKVHLLNYYSHFQERDSQILEQFSVIQFEERCTVNNIYKIGSELIGLITNTHLEQICHSSIILYNFKGKYTMNNIILKNIIILETYLFGNNALSQYQYNNTDLSFQCLGIESSSQAVTQIFPLCAYDPQSTCLNSSDSRKINETSIISYTQSSKQMIISPKISKQAIYYSWLRQSLPKSQGIFEQILQLLD